MTGCAPQGLASECRDDGRSWVDLYWLPLGAGGRSVAFNGRVLERAAAIRHRRRPSALFHSALQVSVAGCRYAIEMTPAAGHGSVDRGVVAEGAVGSKWAGRSIWFRYEVRCWPEGTIDDVAEAAVCVRLSTRAATAQRMVQLVRTVPTPVWGRDDLRTGGMWNSNSLTAWLIGRAGLPLESIHPRVGDRAPGWHAGAVIALRDEAAVTPPSPRADSCW